MGTKPKEPDDALPEWDSLSDSQKDLFTRTLLRIKVWRFVAFALSSTVLLLQPFLSSWYSAQEKNRAFELEKMQKSSETGSEMNRLIFTNLMDLSKELITLKAENEALRQTIHQLQINAAK